MFLKTFLSFVIIQRLMELIIAKKNAKKIKAKGGYEIGKEHYPMIVMLHITFLASFWLEATTSVMPAFWPIPFTIFILAQAMRISVISTLGPFWNTRIYILPQAKPVKKGLYRFMKHPNYVVVMLEMISIPLIFGSYITAILFPVFNALILSVRIRIEEKALVQHYNYEMEMADVPRFVPFRKVK